MPPSPASDSVTAYLFGLVMFTALVAAWFGLLVGSIVLVGRSLSFSPVFDSSPPSRR